VYPLSPVLRIFSILIDTIFVTLTIIYRWAQLSDFWRKWAKWP
jgi:hypothetical protein